MAVPQPGPNDIYGKSPWWPWLSAHIGNQTPPAILGGPITLHGVQEPGGAANFLLPGPRALDPNIFGTADAPKGTELPAIALGAPMKARAAAPDGTQMTAGPSPFGNKVVTVPGDITMTLVDATAMDGATTEDKVDVVATFGSPNGQDVYKVVVKKAAAHGMFIPTGGGVVTNFMQHGVTKWGTELMPTLYSYVSFWGMGNIYKNDELIAEKRVIHGMQTEFVRKAPYDLVFDNEVNPNAAHFHLMIAPITPKGEPSPVPTGFTLPNGKELPFFHVMFPGVNWTSEVNGTPTSQADLPYTSIPASPAMMKMAQAKDAPYKQSPWWPWLSAHVKNDSPPQLLTGPIEVTLNQAEGGAANFLMPGPRMLDPTVFGTTDSPEGMDLPAVVLGLPEQMRADAPGGGQMTKGPTPFGNTVKTVQGSIQATLVDATAMDGARTQDSIDFTATFASPNGKDVYKVVAKAAAPHGWFNPTGGGVITNFIQHGVTKWGTELMPTLYSYVSFWGMGNIYKNDELIAEKRVVHGMLTEFVRKPPYDLAFDNEVNPNAVHFHLMIPPVDPFGNPSPIPTGFMLPNGKELPFFHVMFPTTQAEAQPLGERSTAGSPTGPAAAPTPAQAGTSGQVAREITVTAENLTFTPSEITLKKGETVRFVAQAKDIFHTFTVKKDKADSDSLFSLNLLPGKEPQTYEFTPTETGDLYFYCIPHEGLGMHGVIHVVNK
jgi:plastocyanin